MIMNFRSSLLGIVLISSMVMIGAIQTDVKPEISWIIHCESQHQSRGKGCSIQKENECSFAENLERLERSNVMKDVDGPQLELTPVFNETFSTDFDTSFLRECVNEERWRPNLNITWPVEISDDEKNYFVMITFMNMSGELGQFHQCMHIKIPGSPEIPSKGNPSTTQVVSLISWKLHDFQKRTGLYTLYIRVEDTNNSPSSVMEAGYKVPSDLFSAHGLPLHMRRVVPKRKVNISTFNPRNWMSPLAIFNSSCNRSVRVEFELMPANPYHLTYELTLRRYRYDEQNVMTPFKPDTNDNLGVVTFNNLSTGEYYISLQITGEERMCLTLMKNTRELELEPGMDPCDTDAFYDTCQEVQFRKFHIHDCLSVPMTEPVPKDVPVIVPVLAGLGIAILATALFFAYIICYRNKWEVIRQGVKTVQVEEELNKKTIYLLYCNDNQHHLEVVLKLADLLQQEGHVDVILDAWNTNIPSCMYDWILTQINCSDKVILVGSEAASRYVHGHRRNLHWPKLEQSTPLSMMFPLGVKALLQGHSMNPHSDSSKVMLVSFEYSREEKNKMKSLEQLAGSNLHYRLLVDMESLLLGLHDKPRHSPGSWFHQWANDILQTEAGVKLSAAIEKSVKFKRENPDWFKELYGEPIKFDVERSPLKEKNDERPSERERVLDREEELMALWKGPYSIALDWDSTDVPTFTPPDGHEEDRDIFENEEWLMNEIPSMITTKQTSIDDADNSSLEKMDSGVGMGEFPTWDSDTGSNSPRETLNQRLVDEEESLHLLPANKQPEKNYIQTTNEDLDGVLPDFLPPSSLDSSDSFLINMLP